MNTVEQLLDLKTRIRAIISTSDISTSMHPLTETLMRVEWKLAHPDSEDINIEAIERDL